MKLSDLSKPVSFNLGADTHPEILHHLAIPHALHKFNARLLLGSDWWDDIRQSVYASNGWDCWACTNPREGHLEAHECYDFDFKKRIATCTDIVPLCKLCHGFIHWRGITFYNMRKKVLDHGIKVLLDADLKVPYESARQINKHLPRRKVKRVWTKTKIDAFLSPHWKLDLSIFGLPLEVYPEWSRDRLIV